jgi:hypothetical protein
MKNSTIVTAMMCLAAAAALASGVRVGAATTPHRSLRRASASEDVSHESAGASRSSGSTVTLPSPSPAASLKVCPGVSLSGASAVVVYSDTARQEGVGVRVSSCLFYVPTAVDYDTAKARCASVGYHLLTTAAHTATLMFYARDAVVRDSGVSWWMGGERSGDVATAGWSWVDGTSAANLNCRGGTTGCGGVWSPFQPDNAGGVESRLHYWSYVNAGNDARRAVTIGFVCEREFVCPAGSFCALNSDSVATCPAGTFSVGGATACSPCIDDMISGSGATSCRWCAAGTVSNPAHTACAPR